MSSKLYVGLMSGTSVDAIDAALVDFSGGKHRLVTHLSHAIKPSLKAEILALCHQQYPPLDLLGSVDRDLGLAFAEATDALLKLAGVPSKHVVAIGSHGQTVRHRPDQRDGGPFTMQIGDPNIIAFHTGIATVADFRRMDMAAGGQAAPLAPLFHRAFFGQGDNLSVVNIGGISNVTHLSSNSTSGYDVGPGNVLMDAWIKRHQGVEYDRDGSWALSGSVSKDLLTLLLKHPYLALPYPKSTGREEFNLEWLDERLALLSDQPDADDVQATLLLFTARCIAQELVKQPCQRLLVCGGGARNSALMATIARELKDVDVRSTDDFGIAPEWVEACGFAWLAQQRMAKQTLSLGAITGSQQSVLLGGVYGG
jgi:anhydro-N-acetylmuramic acid kinase